MNKEDYIAVVVGIAGVLIGIIGFYRDDMGLVVIGGMLSGWCVSFLWSVFKPTREA